MLNQANLEDPLVFIRECISAGRVRWTYHVTMRLQQRSLAADMLLQAEPTLEIIEQYPRDKYLPSYLVRGEIKGSILHAQIATDPEGGNIRVVTMYIPDPNQWDSDFRVRRNPR